MIAEPPLVSTAPAVSAPGKESEIAPPTDMPTDALVETICYLFAALPQEKQGKLLTQLAERGNANASHLLSAR